MKKFFLWTMAVLLSPVLLFLALTLVLCIPSVQNWAVRQVAAYVSETTEMTVSVGRVGVSFPLDLRVDRLQIIQPNDSLPQRRDTLAAVRSVTVALQLRPLFSRRVVVDRCEVRDAHFNTAGYVAAARVKGHLERLALRSRGIDLKRQTVCADLARLDNARLEIALSDTVPPDTTKTKTLWRIFADSVCVARTNVTLRLPGDSLVVAARLGEAAVLEADINLGTSRYAVGRFRIVNGSVQCDNPYMPRVKGLDPNHLAFSGIGAWADSIVFRQFEPAAATRKGGMSLRLSLRHLALHEKSGLALTHAHGRMVMDTLCLAIPQLTLRTPSSEAGIRARMDFDAFADSRSGQFAVHMTASVGKADLLHYVGIASPQTLNGCKALFRNYPDRPLALAADARGNLRQVAVSRFEASLPSAFRIRARGQASDFLDARRLKARAAFAARTRNIGFVSTLLPASFSKTFRIPHGLSLHGTASARGSRYEASLCLQEGKGTVRTRGMVNTATQDYRAQLSIDTLNLHHFMPHDSLYTLSARVNVSGRGFDVQSKRSVMKAGAAVAHLGYGSWNLDGVQAAARLDCGVGHVSIDSHNALLDGALRLDALLSHKRVAATLSADVRRADLHALRLTDHPIEVSGCTHVDVSSDFKESHRVQGAVSDLTIRGGGKVYRPTSLDVDVLTRPDTTWAKVSSGDFALNLVASGGTGRLGRQLGRLADKAAAHVRNKVIDQASLRALYPQLRLQLSSGPANPVAAFLRMKGVQFKDLAVTVDASPHTGLNGRCHVYSLVCDSTRIDTIQLGLQQHGPELTFGGHVQNNKKNPQFVFNTLFSGKVLERGAQLDLTYLDASDRVGARLGARAEMCDSGINVHLLPYKPILGYKTFTLNQDNFVFMGANKRIRAKIDLVADDGMGVKVYSEEQDPSMLQDITVSLNKFDLEKITSVMPYAPRMGGLLNGDFRVLQDKDERLSMLSDLTVERMTYEQCPMGNLGTEFVYLQRGDSAHYVEARLNSDGNEVGLLTGTYKAEGKGWLDATFEMEHTPLSLVNGFVPGQIAGLEGYAEGSVSVKGHLDKPAVNGEVYLDSSYVVSVPYGMRLRFDNDPVRIVDSNLLFENFTVYAHNDNPLNIYGQVNFSDPGSATVDLKMRARNYQIVSARKSRHSLAYGNAFVNFSGIVSGRIDQLRMRGQLDVLGKTDMTYILKDSPLNTDDQLKDLVTFTDFRDTTAVAEVRPVVGGLDMMLMMNVEEGARIVCALNADESNYVNLEGGGELRMVYNPTDQLQLFGRYTLDRGEMKYALPIIPLKTFTIKEGSYIEFAGDVMNPRLNLVATETVKALVGAETAGSRSVEFECGVKVTQTLANMGLEFTLDAPDDMTVKNELASMGTEQRGKLAVTMLTTGMYLADGNTSGFSMNSALNSFLQSEINNITKSAMRTVDLSLGLDQTADATGNTHTDYSFKFGKRFWNNRFNFVVGGRISSGNSTAAATASQDETFIDNVSLEYRLDQTSMRYVRVFYNKEAADLLEGRIAEYGAGFVWRKKMDKLHQLFDIRRKSDLMPAGAARPVPSGTHQTDSVKR